MNRSFKIYALFILSLLMVFFLFALVMNETGNASGGRGLIVIISLVLLGLISGLFYLAIRNSSAAAEVSGNQELAGTSGDESGQDQAAEETESREEEKFDPGQLIPRQAANLEVFAEELLRNMSEEFGIGQGLFYFRQIPDDVFKCKAQYAYYNENSPDDFKFGETLPGQAVKNGVIAFLSKVPEDYLQVVSGLGKGQPRDIVFVPVHFKGDVIALIEYATFTMYDPKTERKLGLLSGKIAETIVKLSKK